MLSPKELDKLRVRAKSGAAELKDSHHTPTTQDNINLLLDYIIQLEHLIILADNKIKKITKNETT